MTARFAYRTRRVARQLACAALLLAAGTIGSAHAGDTIRVAVDRATITKLPAQVATIVIGNPLIADVTVQPGGLLVITGKGYGTTNMIALDRTGTVLSEHNIEVLGAKDRIVVVYRGVNRESYSCAPECERRITLGDDTQYFDATLAQASNRAARAQAQVPQGAH